MFTFFSHEYIIAGTSHGPPAASGAMPVNNHGRTSHPTSGLPNLGTPATITGDPAFPIQNNTTPETHTPSLQLSPQQSPAVSTPMPLPLSSPNTPDLAVSAPSTSPTQVGQPPAAAMSNIKSETPMENATTVSPPQQSPSASTSPHHSPSQAYKNSSHQQQLAAAAATNGPSVNGSSPNSNGAMMSPASMGFPPHLFQQQMMGGLMQGALPPNMPPPPPPNHSRLPTIPAAPFPGYMRPPVPTHNARQPQEESPEAMLFNKIVGGAQFPPMNLRPFFQQDGSQTHTAHNPNAMFHRDPSMESIKSEPEPILN